ncbi:hypothetical protein MSIMFB_02623 [Mycobacterium simulans]|uniref:YcaO domain-containing protein n=1 Tax=Mycobacterium simulans TaxID=627089 RepID=A0A7Z7IKB3_9MYCO|nr:hypothetical protein MSIMFB_02623 [Mycobacterium simulans]
MALDDVAGSNCAELVEMIHRAGSELHVTRVDAWDGFFCSSVALTSPTIEIPLSGHGLHHDPNVALSRAITEAAQSRLTAISGAREDLPPLLYHRSPGCTAMPRCGGRHGNYPSRNPLPGTSRPPTRWRTWWASAAIYQSATPSVRAF